MADPAHRPAKCWFNWVDEEVVVCCRGPNTLASGRKPDDLPAFCCTMVGTFAVGH